MAINAIVVWEVRTTGSQTNGGGWKPGASGTDFSQQAAAQYALTIVTSLGATATMTHASAAAVMVGNTCRTVSGTNAILGWYEIISVNIGVDITVDRNWCTGACNDGVVNVGGAFKAGGSLDGEFFQYGIVAGNTVHIAQGTYTTGEHIGNPATGSESLPIRLIGYHDARGDNPVGNDRPLFTLANYQFVHGSYWRTSNVRYTTTYSSGIQMSGYNTFIDCKAINTSANANYPAFNVAGSIMIRCEGVSRLGYAFSISSGQLHYCYAHDSKYGIVPASGTVIDNCIVETCQRGINIDYASRISVVGSTIRNCLNGLYGSNAGGTSHSVIVNCIIADCFVGAYWTSTMGNIIFYNVCWSNNDTDVTNVTKGSNNVTADALLGSSVAEGTDGATGATGLVFTAASNPFAGVTTSDFLNIVETGTGATLGVYAIASVDSIGQITLATSAAANKANIDYCIVKGTDFTLQAGSPCFDAGLKLGAAVGL